MKISSGCRCIKMLANASYDYEISFHKTEESDSLFQKCYEYNRHCHFHCRILLNTKQTLKGGRNNAIVKYS